jgi:hypothetical protein
VALLHVYSSIEEVGPSAPATIIPPVSLVVNRPDVFPVGISVSAYPAAAAHDKIHAAGTATETHTVASDGSLTYTTLSAEGTYVLYAEVAGKDRYIQCANQSFTPPPTGLIERIKERREAAGIQ